MSPQIFISYDRRDMAQAKEIYEFIRDCGCEPFFDAQAILPGDRWRAKSLEQLELSQAVVLIISPHSVNSRNTVYEEFQLALQLAQQETLVVIPICVFPVSLPAEIAAFHIEHWDGRGKTTLRRKLKQIREELNGGLLLGGALLASLLGGSYYLWKNRKKKQAPPPSSQRKYKGRGY